MIDKDLIREYMDKVNAQLLLDGGKVFASWSPNSMGVCVVPEGCEKIGMAAFSCKELKSVFLPRSMKTINTMAFGQCPNWTGIHVDKDNPILSSQDNVLFEKKNKLLRCPCGRKGEYEVPDGTKYIEMGAFDYCYELKVITLPASIKKISYCAFGTFDKINLEKIRIPKGQYARFAAMDGLKDYINILEEYVKYEEVERNMIPEKVVAMIQSVNVIKKEDSSLAMQVHIKGGQVAYWHLTRECKLKEGDKVDPKTIEQIILECEGEDDIYRYEARALKNEEAVSHPKYIFFDTETAGLPSNYNAPYQDTDNWPRLVQLAWILTDEGGNEIKSKSAIISPDGFKIPANAVEIHGITTERAKREGWALQSVVNEFMQDVDCIEKIVGHNIEFDKHIVGAELYRLGMNSDTLMDKQSICTMRASTDFCAIPNPNAYYGGYKWPSLQELYCKLFDHEFSDAHDALADITATKECFFELKRRGII